MKEYRDTVTDISGNHSTHTLLGPNVARFMAGISVAQSLYTQGKAFYNKQKTKRLFEISISAETDLYMPVQSWLMDLLPEEEVRSLELLASRHKNVLGKRIPRDVLLSFDESIDQKITVDGYPIRVYTYTDQATISIESESDSFGGTFPTGPKKRTLKIECKTIEARNHILSIIKELLDKADKDIKGSRGFSMSRWGDWNPQVLIDRPLDTVYLPGSVKEHIKEDVRLFLGSEKSYLHFGLPWHRGYLFSGSPGTGKTSLAKSLATHFNLDIYVIAIPDLKSDTDITSSLNNIQAPGILLIEDIDVASAASSREEHKDTVSLSGLLNALDGVGTPHGLITIMTSNHPEVLDPALVRTGRIDYKVECNLLSGDELRSMTKEILDIELDKELKDGISPAEVMEVVKQTMHEGNDVTARELIDKFGLTEEANHG